MPKIKDLVNKPNEQYKDIFNTIHGNNTNKPTMPSKNVVDESMTNELTQFFNDLKKTSTVTNDNKDIPLGEPLNGSNSSNSSNAYSPF